jgi:hypothetical protein
MRFDIVEDAPQSRVRQPARRQELYRGAVEMTGDLHRQRRVQRLDENIVEGAAVDLADDRLDEERRLWIIDRQQRLEIGEAHRRRDLRGQVAVNLGALDDLGQRVSRPGKDGARGNAGRPKGQAARRSGRDLLHPAPLDLHGRLRNLGQVKTDAVLGASPIALAGGAIDHRRQCPWPRPRLDDAGGRSVHDRRAAIEARTPDCRTNTDSSRRCRGAVRYSRRRR